MSDGVVIAIMFTPIVLAVSFLLLALGRLLWLDGTRGFIK